MTDTEPVQHEHEWQVGPVTRWRNISDRDIGVPVQYATGGEAVSLAVMCRCGEWRNVPVAGRYRGEVGP